MNYIGGIGVADFTDITVNSQSVSKTITKQRAEELAKVFKINKIVVLCFANQFLICTGYTILEDGLGVDFAGAYNDQGEATVLIGSVYKTGSVYKIDLNPNAI